jgi:hypothetical protein
MPRETDELDWMLGQHISGKWHVMEPDGTVIAEYDLQEEAAQHIDRLMGSDKWAFDIIRDEEGSMHTAMLEMRQRENRGEKSS